MWLVTRWMASTPLRGDPLQCRACSARDGRCTSKHLGEQPTSVVALQARVLWQAAGAKLYSEATPRIQTEYANLIASNTPPDRCTAIVSDESCNAVV